MREQSMDEGTIARGESLRAAVALLLVVLLLAVVANKLTSLQVEAATSSRALVARTVHETRVEAAPRGRILDRHGRVLAEDVPGHEVRGEYYLSFEKSAAGAAAAERRLDLLADELTSAVLAGEAPSTERRAATRQVLRGRLARAAQNQEKSEVELRPARETRPALVRRKLDFLVADDLRSTAAVLAMTRLTAEREWRPLHLHFQTTYERVYPGGEACVGPVGFIAERDRQHEVRQRIEAIDGLRAGQAGERTLLRGASKTRYWQEDEATPVAAGTVTTTLDLDLQAAAQAELEHAVADVVTTYKTEPNWGALVLADVETGDILAMGSWVAGAHPRAAAFTPIQSVFEPGSSVKPLVLSMVLAQGRVDWDHERIDCSEGAPGRGWWVDPPGQVDQKRRRRIVDDHAVGVVTPHEVIVQSSNVGAVKLGLRLGPQGLDDYVETFQLSSRTGLGLPGELAGGRKRDLPSLGATMFWHYTGPSLCFGYEASVTAVQMLRAYMTLLARQPRELRLLAAVERDGVQVPLQRAGSAARPPFLREEDLDRIKAAMAGVVSKAHGATGRHVAEMIEGLGFAPGVIAGKTGTSVRTLPDGSRNRTASFAGFAPVATPRFVAFCVLQKDRAEGFYGGRYAALAASRLLLRALGVLDTAGVQGGAVRSQQVSARDPGRRTVTPSNDR